MDFIFKWVVYFISSFIRIITTATRPISEWVLDILYWVIIGRTMKLPPINNKVLLLSARELAAKIRNRELRAEEVMAAYIQRCKSIHPIINAQVDERFNSAMEEAISVDQMLDRSTSTDRLARFKPLLGVPFSCKESIGVRGLAQTNGRVSQKNRKAPFDADTTALYREAGAIPVVVTNVPVYSMWWETANRIFGRTKNPFDKRRSVGGSSGGEAALITTCGGIIGIGSDFAGSIRIPAAFCGIYGHKPTSGLVSNMSALPFRDEGITDEYETTGPMCRYVEDLPMLTMLLAGENANKVNWLYRIEFRRMAVFYMEELPGWLLSATSDIKASVRKAVRHFETEYNITATKLYIPELKHAFAIWECKTLESGIPPLKELMESGQGRPINFTWEFIKSIFRRSEFTFPALYNAAVDRTAKNKYYYKCLDMYNEIKRKLEEYLEGDAILLLPTTSDPAPHYLMTIPKYPNLAYTCIFNALGYPVTQVPTGMSRGVPIGIQVVSTQNKDNLTLAAAVELDKVFNGWINPGPVVV